MAYIPSSGSVVGFQSQPSSLLVGASVIGLTPVAPTPSSVMVVNTVSTLSVTQGTSPWVVNVPTPSYISYQAAGSIMAVTGGNTSVTAFQGGAWSTSITGGYVNVIGSILAAGSIAAYQGNSPWIVNMPSPSVVAVHIAGSVLAVRTDNASVVAVLSNSSVAVLQGTSPWLITGSVASLEPGGIRVTSLVSTIPSSVMVGASVFGTVPVTQVTSPWIINQPSPSIIALQVAGSILAINMPSSSVIAYQLAGSIMQVTGGGGGTQYVENNAVTASVTGNAILYKKDETNSVLSAVSPQHPLPVQGSVTALQGTNPWIINVPTPSYLSIQPGGSILNANISGSVAAAVINFTASVAANINVISASISANQGTNPWVIGSIVGTYAEDAASSSGDKGLFVMGVRNDTMTSMTSADLDYSSHIVGPAGEMITANSPITKWFSGNACILTGTSIQVIAAPGASIFSYITGIHVMNDSANATRVTITQGLGRIPGSMLTWAVAPASGGSNMTFPNGLRVLDNNGISASISAVASIYVTITGFNSKT